MPRDGDDIFSRGGEMGRRMRETDWSATPLGDPAAWPPALIPALSICLGSGFPIAIYWGPGLTLLYNDAWSPILGAKHPWALGRPALDVWPEIWDTIGPMFAQVLGSGAATYSEDQLLLMRRHGYTEECYFNYTFSPITGEGTRVEGVFNAVIETTFRVIAERRTRVLRDVGERVATARSADEACAIAVQALSEAPHDVPFCAVYRVENDGQARLAASSGLPGEPPWDEPTVALGGAADSRSGWPLHRAWRSGHVELVDDLSVRFGPGLPGGPWPEPARGALIAPMAATATSRPSGFLVIGASPRRAVDEEYRQFAERAAAHLATAIANATALDSERRRAEALAEVDRAKTVFFSNVSHELRTPLTLILGPTEDALRAPDQALSGEALRVVHRNELRLLKLVNTLLDFARIEAGRLQPRFERTDVGALTADLASTFRSAVERAGVALTVSLPSPPVEAWIDRDMWEKVILNLLSNALKHTFDGSIALHVRSAGDAVEVVVADTGVGIPAEHLPRLFDRFYRVPSSRSRTHEGTGIGLALVHELIALHNGSIAVESTEGAGTTFRIALPAASGHAPAARSVDQALPSVAPSSSQTFVEEASRWLPDAAGAEPLAASDTPAVHEAGAARYRAVVVDDNRDMREYLARLLASRFTVRAAADGLEALQLLRDEPADVVISDVMMPRLDGIGLLAGIRREWGGAAPPVVLLSARAGEDARIEGLESGADDYLVKPFSARELIATVQAHARLFVQRREFEERERALRLAAEQSAVEVAAARDAAGSDAERLNLALAAARLGDWSWDAATDAVTFSARAAEIFDVPHGPHLTWAALRELLHPDDRERARLAVEDAIAARRNYGMEYRLINGGRERWVLASGRGRYARDGTCLGMFGVVQDVTPARVLVRVDDAVRPLTDPAEITYTAAAVLGQHLDVNRCAYAEVEDDEDTFVLTGNYTNGVHSIVGRYTFGQFGAECLRLMRAGQPYVVHDSEQDARIDEQVRGSYRLTAIRSVVCVPILKSGRFVAAMAVHAVVPRQWESEEVELVAQVASRCWESIERTRVERERAALLEAAQSANRAKDEFLAMLGHELRNPLSPILTALQLMKVRGGAMARERTVIERQVAHLTRLVDDLLDVSRIARGKVELKQEVLELSDVVARGIEMASPLLEQRAHTLTVDVPRAGLTVHGDGARLSQVVSNLLMNAAKYTPGSGHITVRARVEGGEVVLRVIDTGIGIAHDVLPHVFDLFVQGRQALDRAAGGLGLGLTIVRNLIERHGGRVSAHSEGAGRGSEFVVRLPKADGPALTPVPRAPEQVVRGSANMRILVVDDNHDAAEMLADALRTRGYETAVAHDGPAALERAAAGGFDAALLDIGLPVMDGYELAARLKEMPQLHGLRLIAVTGYGQESDRRRTRAAGFHHHLVKPVDIDVLATLLAPVRRR